MRRVYSDNWSFTVSVYRLIYGSLVGDLVSVVRVMSDVMCASQCLA